MQLLDDATLERSAVVANCRMNRERDLLGSNGYDRELGFNPIEFLRGRGGEGRSTAWLDLCCGTGRALIQAARSLVDDPVEIVGVDLVGSFDRPEPGLTRLRLVEASLTSWRAERAFDLITCVHGLHYVGDKLGLIARAVSWLGEDGVFVASLDPANLWIDGDRSSRAVLAEFRRAGLAHDRRRRIISCRGRRAVEWPFRYLGADDRAGPNHTGQAAVDSHYERKPLR